MDNCTINRRSPLGLFAGQPIPRLYERIVEVLDNPRCSQRSEQAYIHWIQRLMMLQTPTHSHKLAEEDVNRYLMHLAMRKNVPLSTQNQPLGAMLFLHEHMLERIEAIVRVRDLFRRSSIAPNKRIAWQASPAGDGPAVRGRN